MIIRRTSAEDLRERGVLDRLRAILINGRGESELAKQRGDFGWRLGDKRSGPFIPLRQRDV